MNVVGGSHMPTPDRINSSLDLAIAISLIRTRNTLHGNRYSLDAFVGEIYKELKKSTAPLPKKSLIVTLSFTPKKTQIALPAYVIQSLQEIKISVDDVSTIHQFDIEKVKPHLKSLTPSCLAGLVRVFNYVGKLSSHKRLSSSSHGKYDAILSHRIEIARCILKVFKNLPKESLLEDQSCRELELSPIRLELQELILNPFRGNRDLSKVTTKKLQYSINLYAVIMERLLLDERQNEEILTKEVCEISTRLEMLLHTEIEKTSDVQAPFLHNTYAKNVFYSTFEQRARSLRNERSKFVNMNFEYDVSMSKGASTACSTKIPSEMGYSVIYYHLHLLLAMMKIYRRCVYPVNCRLNPKASSANARRIKMSRMNMLSVLIVYANEELLEVYQKIDWGDV